MKLKTQALENTSGILITAEGENLDASNSKDFKESIQPYLDSHILAIVDLSPLRFVDSSGLGVLLSCLRTMNNKESQLKLIGLTKPVRALFELVRMHRIFSIYNSLDEALASI
ncbi:STAS domain-containing protein [Propionivibrio sp.]|uniref:STAS domain-containing protein n=1 Tax=Propionivibrio sp. TaxID=2212460 RepID=UPI003BF072B4